MLFFFTITYIIKWLESLLTSGKEFCFCGFCYYHIEFSLKKLEFFWSFLPSLSDIYCKWQVCFLLGLKQQKLWNIQFYCLHFWDFLNMFNLLLTILKVFISNDQIRQYTYKEFAHLHNIVNVMSIVSDRSHKYAPTTACPAGFILPITDVLCISWFHDYDKSTFKCLRPELWNRKNLHLCFWTWHCS